MMNIPMKSANRLEMPTIIEFAGELPIASQSLKRTLRR